MYIHPKNTAYKRFIISSAPKYGEKGSVPIDQTPSQDFNINPDTGRPMSDIQKLVKCQNDLQMQAAFSQLHEFKSNYLPDNISDSDALQYLCPRLSQLPSELLAYKDKLVQYQLYQQQEKAAKDAFIAKEKADKEYIENFKKSLVESKKS